MTQQKGKRSFDVDGVLLDFHRHIYEYNNLVPTSGLTGWDQPEIWLLWQDVLHDHKFWETIPALNDPNDIDVDFDYYLTAIPLHLVPSRRKNLISMSFPDKPIIASDDKLTSCRDYNITHHIDDKNSTVVTLNEDGVNCVKYIPHYMNEETTPWDMHDIKDLKERWK